MGYIKDYKRLDIKIGINNEINISCHINKIFLCKILKINMRHINHI